MPADHLDDDVISDAIDGVDPAAPAAQHLASCPSCQARLARFTEASRLVAAPVPPLGLSAVDLLVDRAMAAPVVSIDDLSERRRSAKLDPKQARLLRTMPPPWLVAVAAAVALVVGIPALLDVTGTGTRRDTLSAGRSSDAVSEGSTAGASALGGGSASSAGGDDLGALESDAAVVASLRARLDVVQSEALPLAEPTAGAADQAAAPQARAASKAAPQNSEFEDSAGPPVPTCKAEAKAAASGSSGGNEPIYYAAATWQGRAAMVFVFTLAQPAGDGTRRQAYVMAVPECAVAAAPRF